MPPKKSETGSKPKAATKSTGPSYQDMIKDAIINLKERTGSSRSALKKYVKANNKINATDAHFDHLFNKALKAGVEKGEFHQPKGPSGTTKLAKKEAKAAAPKKAAVKKAAAPKAAGEKKPAAKKAAAPKKPTVKKVAAPKKAAAPKAAAATKKKAAAPVNAPAVVEKPTTLTKTKSGRVAKTTSAPKKPAAKKVTKKAATPKKAAA